MNWKKILAIGAVCMGLLVLWMNRYKYIHFSDTPVRVNRVTGDTEMYVPGSGWQDGDGDNSNQ